MPRAWPRCCSALRLRAWRHDAYRTKLKDEQKRSLEKVAVIGAPDGAEAAWQVEEAIAEGVEFTRELVTEPPNVIYPGKLRRALPRALRGHRRRAHRSSARPR